MFRDLVDLHQALDVGGPATLFSVHAGRYAKKMFPRSRSSAILEVPARYSDALDLPNRLLKLSCS
jgi:hypothetical protein